MINLENDSGHDVQMMLVKYDYEPQFTDDRYIKYSQGQQINIQRFSGRKYFIFVSDIDYVYGFILVGGTNYSYKGKGKMWDSTNNYWSQFNLLEDRPGQIGFYALLDEASLYLEGESINLRENEQVYLNRPAGRYVIGYDSDYQNIINKYAVQSGVSYYIAKGQMIVECNTNIIVKPYGQGDVHDSKPLQKTLSTNNSEKNTFLKNSCGRIIQVFLMRLNNNSYLLEENYNDLNDNFTFNWNIEDEEAYFLCIRDCEIIYGFIVHRGGIYNYSQKGSLLRENEGEFHNFKQKIVERKKANESIAFYALFQDTVINWNLLNRKTTVEKYKSCVEGLLEDEINLISFESDVNNQKNFYPVFCGRTYIIIKESVLVDAETNVIVKLLPEEVFPIFYNRSLESQREEKTTIQQIENISSLTINQKWKTMIHKITRNTLTDYSSLAYLDIKCLDPNFKSKTLLIPVIDESGSMEGNPTRQVKYSLQKIVDLTFQYRNLLTYLVGYSDSGVSYTIDPDKNSAENYHRLIEDKFGRGGGTYFSYAFQGVIDCLNKYKDNPDISSVVVVFLTDGEDSTNNNRTDMVNNFKRDFENTWKIHYTVHSIGFGKDHDYDFLNKLRQIGTTEGAYRYANPDEDNDSLSKKISSVTEVIAGGSALPIEVVDSSGYKIIAGENGQYWLDLTNVNCNVNFNIKILINKREEVTLTTEFAEYENEIEIWTKWVTYLIDTVATEFVQIVSKYSSYGSTLDPLIGRLQKIIASLDEENSEYARANKLLEMLRNGQSGRSVDEKVINNLKFDGKYAVEPKKQLNKRKYVRYGLKDETFIFNGTKGDIQIDDEIGKRRTYESFSFSRNTISCSVRCSYRGKDYGKNLVGVRYGNIIYYFPVRNGDTYCFTESLRLFDFNQQRYLPLPEEKEGKTMMKQSGNIGFENLTKSNIKISLSGGNDQRELQQRQCVQFARQSGKYIATTNFEHDKVERKYVVISGCCYFLYRGALFDHESFLAVEIYDDKKANTNAIGIHNGTKGEIQVAISIDKGTNQNNGYVKVASKGQNSWTRTEANFYQCCVFFKNVVYNFIVRTGKSYSFIETKKLIDLDTNSPVTIDDLEDQEGVISIRAIGGEFSVSVTGGNEGTYDMSANTTSLFYRDNGNYIMTITFNGQEKKYQVTSGYAYIIWMGNLICYRTSIYIEVYTETITTIELRESPIDIINGISNQISVSIGKDEGSNHNTKFIQLNSGRTQTWTRYSDYEYQCFILDSDSFTYGFIIRGGGNYTYQGQGKLWDNNVGIYAEEDDLDLSTPGYVVVKAFRCNVQVTLDGGADNSFDINQNQYVRFARKQGNYVLQFKDLKGVEKKYLVTTGRSYYIYNSGSCIDKDSNIVLPLYTGNQGSVVTYDDENINSVVQINGASSSWQQWSSSYSNKTQVSYSKVETHSSSSVVKTSHVSNQSSSSFQTSFDSLGGNLANFPGMGVNMPIMPGMPGMTGMPGMGGNISAMGGNMTNLPGIGGNITNFSGMSSNITNFSGMGGNMPNLPVGMNINGFQGMTGGNMMMNFNQPGFPQMSGMNVQTSSFSSSTAESFSSQKFY